jgi:hypothetical protein
MAKLANGGGNATSLAHNNAAKDDCLALDPFNSYNISALYANDPGSAHDLTIITPGITVGADGSFSLPWGVTSFDYKEQMANGTYSTAHVNLAAHVGDELVQNWSFEDPRPDAASYGGSVVNGQIVGGFTSGSTLPGWTGLNGVSLEDVSEQYGGFSTINGTHWLDSQGSPGGIDISQVLQMTAGTAHLEFIVAKEPDIVLPGGAVFQQDPNEQLHFLLGGTEVADLKVSDFATPGVFQTFDCNVNVAAGANTLEIKADHASANVGFAIDSVSVRQMVAAPCNDYGTV